MRHICNTDISSGFFWDFWVEFAIFGWFSGINIWIWTLIHRGYFFQIWRQCIFFELPLFICYTTLCVKHIFECVELSSDGSVVTRQTVLLSEETCIRIVCLKKKVSENNQYSFATSQRNHTVKKRVRCYVVCLLLWMHRSQKII